MADFNKPNRDQEYVNALPDTRDNQEALAKMFNGVSVLNIPVNSVQFAGGQFNLWDGGNWNVQAIGISGGGTGAKTAAGARTNLGVISETDGDAKYLKQASNLADLNDKATARTELQVLGIANNLSDVNDAATAFDNIKQDATVSNKGVVEKATDIEMINGTADKFPDCQSVKGWVESATPSMDEDTIGTSGSLTSGSADIVKVGRLVTISGSFGHSSQSAPTSGEIIPVEYRPSSDITNSYFVGLNESCRIAVTSGGFLYFAYFDWNGSYTNRTSTREFSITYTVA